jgi:hypothetical protein
MGLCFTYRKKLVQMRFYAFVQIFRTKFDKISNLHILTKKINKYSEIEFQFDQGENV